MTAAAVARSSQRRLIPELLIVHAEELGFLWERRRRSINSPMTTVRDLSELSERIEAHTQGLLIAGDSLPDHLAAGLSATERDQVFASAYPLLRTGDSKIAQCVATAFGEAMAERLAGLRDALSLAGIAHIKPAMRHLLETGDAAHAAAAAAVLVSHKHLDPVPARLAALAADADPEVATLAWQVVAALGNVEIPIERTYVDAIKGQHAGVRDAAIGAAVWRGEFWVSGVMRRLAEDGDPVGLNWFAAIAGADAAPIMQNALSRPIKGISRSRIAARYGNPALMPLILEEMSSDDALTASAAGEAFTRIAGIDVAGQRKTLPVRDDADEFEREFAEDVWVPDVARAQQVWDQRRATWDKGVRWCRGCEISARITKEDRNRIDLEALNDFGARAVLAGERITAPNINWL
jgi:uncharacterized protein (TIGR02270 family)